MWIRIRAVIIEDEPLAAEYLAKLLDETYQVEVVGSATESETGLRLCAELRPDAAFLDINLPGKDGLSLATQLSMLPQPPRLVFTTGNASRASEAFRLAAVDYLLKPLDPEQVNETVNRLLAYMRPFESGSFPGSVDQTNEEQSGKVRFAGTENQLLRVKMQIAIGSGCWLVTRLQQCCDVTGGPGFTPCGKSFPPTTRWPMSWSGWVAIPLFRSAGMRW